MSVVFCRDESLLRLNKLDYTIFGWRELQARASIWGLTTNH